MKPIHFIAGAVGFVLALVVTIPSAQAANRPGSELNFFQILNGEQSRDLNAGAESGGLADGGGITLMTLDAGIGCNALATGAVYEMHCDSAGYLCLWGDGGCSSAISSQAYGRPINSSTPNAPAPVFFTLQTDTTNATKLVCVTPASGDATMICAPFRLR
jgi:hypothetical protein